MDTRRLLIDTLVALSVAVLLMPIGWFAATWHFELIVDAAHIDHVVATGPTELPWLRAKLALVFGLAPVIGWITALVRRLRRGTCPSVTAMGTYLALPMLAVVVGLPLKLVWLLIGLQRTIVQGEVEPMVTVGSLSLASGGLKLGLLCGAAMVAFQLLRPREKREVVQRSG